MSAFTQNFSKLQLSDFRACMETYKADNWRYVQILAVNLEEGIDLIYSFMKDGELQNKTVSKVTKDDVIPSITDLFLEAFVCENEIHDLYGISIENMAIDFGGTFYDLAIKEPMTIISPEQKAAREKARKIAAARGAKEARTARAAAANADFLSTHPESKDATKKSAKIVQPSEEELNHKLAGMDPEKVARVKAAMAAKAKKAAEQANKDGE